MRTPLRAAVAAVCLLAIAFPARAEDRPVAQALAYRMTPGKTLRYKLTADVHASAPIMESPKPIDFHAVINVVYLATPKTLLADGTSDVELVVESADAELEQIPLPFSVEDAQKFLNQTITIARNGEVKRVAGGQGPPFNVSIPGVDPTRLYALLFPVVFRNSPVKPGDKWTFKSALVEGQGRNDPKFVALMLPRDSADSAAIPIREEFTLKVDQRLDENKKPVVGGAKPYRTRKGTITGSGTLSFNAEQGQFAKGVVDIKANVAEALLGEPKSADEPKTMVSTVNARVTVELAPETDKAVDTNSKANP